FGPRARDRADVLLVQRGEPADGDRAAARDDRGGGHRGPGRGAARLVAVAAGVLDRAARGGGGGAVPAEGDPLVLPAAFVPGAAAAAGRLGRGGGKTPGETHSPP